MSANNSAFESFQKLCYKIIEQKNYDDRYKNRLIDELKYIKLLDRAEYIILQARQIAKGESEKRKNSNGLVFTFLLGITDIDPIESGIPHNKYLSDPPDIDIDLSEDAKSLIEDLLIKEHGPEHVAHIITTNMFTPKSTLRDLCRLMSLTTDQKIIKQLTEHFGTEIGEGNDFEAQINNFLNMKDEEKLSKELVDFLDAKPKYIKLLPKGDHKLTNQELLFKYATRLSGQVSHTGKHASGVAISSEPFYEFAPLKKVKGEVLLALQEGGHNKEVSTFGCLKYDWLGLKNVTKHVEFYKLAKEMYNVDLYEKLVYLNNWDDSKTIKLFDEGKTLGVFQFSGKDMRACLRRATITSFQDIAIMNAIFRPGPLNNLEKLISNMKNPDSIEYENAGLEKVLKSTYGIIVYQEQVMQIMQVIGGMTGAEADKSRSILKKLSRNKSPDKKSVEYYEYQKALEKFQAGATKNGLSADQAEQFVHDLSGHMGYCLDGDTVIRGCNKQIKDVVPGDIAIAYDLQTKQFVETQITRIYKQGMREVYEFTTTNGMKIKSTLSHKYLCEDNVMRPMRDIWFDGLKIKGCVSGDETLLKVNMIACLGNVETYDIEVEHRDHNFLAGYSTHSFTNRSFIVSNSFNKAHAVSYSATAYIDAYFKTHYPLIFYKVLLDYEGDRQMISMLLQDAKAQGVEVGEFDINRTDYTFKIDRANNAILIGYNMIKGLRRTEILKFIEHRKKLPDAKYETIQQFLDACESINLSINTVRPLILLGILDRFEKNRRKMLYMYEEYFQKYMKKRENKTAKGRWTKEQMWEAALQDPEYTSMEDYSDYEKTQFQFEYLEMYMDKGPITNAENYLKPRGLAFVSVSDHHLSVEKNPRAIVLGIIGDVKVKKTRNNVNYLDIQFTDLRETINVKVWSDKITHKLQQKGKVFLMNLKYQADFDSYSLTSSYSFEDLKAKVEGNGKGMPDGKPLQTASRVAS